MPCYHPIPAERTADGLKLHPKDSNGYAREPSYWLPCGKCLGCREIQQQQMAIRIAHEARFWKHKHFLTLTYSEDKVPDGLQKPDMQKFWKRVRRAGHTIRHLTCGEYGDITKRPHYHAAVMGLRIDDLKRWDSESYTSTTIDKLWGNGIVTIGELTEARMRYVAGYVLKKAGYRKQLYCDEDGVELQPPYRDMSKSIGQGWAMQFRNDLRHGYLQHDGAKIPIPRYYTDVVKREDTRLAEAIQETKARNGKELTAQDRQNLHTGEIIRQAQIRAGTGRGRV